MRRMGAITQTDTMIQPKTPVMRPPRDDNNAANNNPYCLSPLLMGGVRGFDTRADVAVAVTDDL